MTALRARRVLVTGGSSGLGLAMARRFAAEGAEVVLAGRDAGRLESAWKTLDLSGAACTVQLLDVTCADSIETARSAIHARHGPIDVLVNNAGVVAGGAFLDVSLDTHRRVADVNTAGVVAMTHAFLPDLIARDGHLVNMASAAGLIGLPWGASYAASKWAVIGFSESIRLELRELGHPRVGVTTVCPSYARTGMFEGVTPPRLTGLLDPDRLAARIVRAVERDRPFVRAPWLVAVTPLLLGVFPRRLTDVVSRRLGVTTGMRTWTGRAER